MVMGERDYDEESEDDGVLEPADSLETDDLRADVLDTGVDAGEGYRGATRFGTTWEEERRGESLDQLLAEEEPEQSVDDEWTDEDAPSDDERTEFRRSGRLVAADDGSHPDTEADAAAYDAGTGGGGASPADAAMPDTAARPLS